MGRLIILLILMVPLICKAGCESFPQRSERSVIGKEPLASRLYAVAQAKDFGPWKSGTFNIEHFYFVGTLQVFGKPVHVAYISTYFEAEPACRNSEWLLLFNAKLEPAGRYYGISKPSINGNSLVFNEGEKGESTVSMSRGLPAKIDGGWGVLYDFEGPSMPLVKDPAPARRP